MDRIVHEWANVCVMTLPLHCRRRRATKSFKVNVCIGTAMEVLIFLKIQLGVAYSREY